MAQATTTEPADFQPLRPAFLKKVFVGFAAMVLLSAGISLAGNLLGDRIAMAGHSDDPRQYEVVIGNNVLMVPGNEIRFERARHSGIAERLDVYFEWPSMQGYSAASRDTFNLTGGNPLIFLALERRIMSRDMSGRLDPIYSAIIEFPGKAGPAGLMLHALRRDAGYSDEMLAIGPMGSGERFVARCLIGPSAEQSIAPCERDIHMGDKLVLTYRFPREMLAEWKSLEQAIRAKAGRYMRIPASGKSQSRSMSRMAIEKL